MIEGVGIAINRAVSEQFKPGKTVYYLFVHVFVSNTYCNDSISVFC